MGEAKRRNKQGQVFEDALRRRLAAGEFGTDGALRCMVVVDKSAGARDTLRRLRDMPEFAWLAPALVAEEAQMWEASALFPYLLAAGDRQAGTSRVWLAADLPRLTGGVLAQAADFMAPGGYGVLVLADASVGDQVQASLSGTAAPG